MLGRRAARLRPPPRLLPHRRGAASFASLRLRPPLLAALDDMGLAEPTEVQEAAVPAILGGRDVLIASETGSGKTLGYLLPVVQLLKEQEEKGGRATRLQRPRAVVVVPSREVGRQVLRSVKALSHHAKLASASLCNQPTAARRAAAVTSRPIDVLVSTPGRLLDLLQQGPQQRGRGRGGDRVGGRQGKAEPTLFLSDVRFLVFDEADVLFDDEFGPTLLPMLRRLLRAGESRGRPLQCVLAGASWPGGEPERLGRRDGQRRQRPGKRSPLLHGLLRGELRDAVRAESSGLHRLPDNLELSFRLVPPQQKPAALLDTLRHVAAAARREAGPSPTPPSVMVFANTSRAAVFVTALLREEAEHDGLDWSVSALHGSMTPADREHEFERFHAPAEEAGLRVLVCTDVGSRGLDIEAVEHVVLFDCPKNPVDFLHRVGRTARAGAAGRATCLYHKSQDGEVVRALKEAYRRKLPVRGLVGWDHSHREGQGEEAARARA